MKHVLALVPLLLVPTIGGTDEGDPVVAGDRVRVTAPSVARELFEGRERRFTGEVLSLDEETLTISVRKRSDPAVVPRTAIDRLEVSRAPSRKGRGFLIGLLAGTAVGVGLVALDNGSSACDSTSVTGCDVALSAVLLGIPSAVVVALVAPGERWEETGVDAPRVALGIAPVAGGVGVSVRWRSESTPPRRRARVHERTTVVPDRHGPPPPASLVSRSR